jgi:hypothetical protein
MSVRIVRLALASADCINQKKSSEPSVEKPIVVPWKLSRERRICFAASRREARSGTFTVRSSTFSQSSTAEVGHRFGSMVMESRRAGSMAW